jgi:hypothetical protein
MVGDLIMELQAELALDVRITTCMQLINNFEGEASVLALLQNYLHGFHSEAGDGDTTRWYQEAFFIKKLEKHLTLPEVFTTALDNYPGDTDEINLALDAFFGWLKKEAVHLDLKQRQSDKQQRPGDTDATFALGLVGRGLPSTPRLPRSNKAGTLVPTAGGTSGGRSTATGS